MKILTTAVLALSAAVAIPVASAQSAEVRFSDLDLGSPEGKAELERRIKAVSRQACKAEAPSGTNIVDRAAQKQCQEDIRNQVMSSIPK